MKDLQVTSHAGDAIPEVELEICARLFTSLNEFKDYATGIYE